MRFMRYDSSTRSTRLNFALALLGVVSLFVSSVAFAAPVQEEADRIREREQAEHAAPRPPAGGTILTGVPAQIIGSAIVNLRELAAEEARKPAYHGPLIPLPTYNDEKEEEFSAEPDATAPLFKLPKPGPQINVAGPSPSTTFIGLDDIPIGGTGFIVIPPDVDAAVGRKKVMEGLNNNYRIFDKCTGLTLSTISMNTFWAASGGTINSFFDPKTIYDPIQDRWIVVALADAVTANASIVVGISLTDDPEGSYYIFRVKYDNAGNTWGDFPEIGFNKNNVAINTNIVDIPSGAATGVGKMLVIDYPQFRTGTLTATLFPGSGFCSAPCATYSPTEPTLYVPTHLSSAGGTYRIDTITGTVGGGLTYTTGITKSRGLTWTQPGGNVLPQAAPLSGASVCGATPCKIETADAQIRSTPVFKNGFIYYAQTVATTGTTHTMAQWTKLDATTLNVADGGRIEDVTATATNGGKWYSHTHIAANSVGDIIVSWSQFASNQYPSSGYSYRFGGDAPGTMRDPFIYKPGDDYYHKTFTTATGRNRWGDYSKAQVDPTDDRSLWVVSEYAKTRTGTDDGNTGSNSSKWGTFFAMVAGPNPTVSIAPGPSLPEGNAGLTPMTFTVNLSAAHTLPVIVNYQTNDGTATVANNDYQPVTGSITICPGLTSGTITINAVGDTKFESDETYTVTLTGATNATLGAPLTSTGTILNDDTAPVISIDDVSKPEGNSGPTLFNFTVSISNTSDQPISVDYTATEGSATFANNDFNPASGTLVFPPKTTGPQTLTVVVNGDTKTEGTEIFNVLLSNPINATIGDPLGLGIIQNDDNQPLISIDDVSHSEGNAGTTAYTFSVTLSNTSDQTVSVDYTTNDGTAKVANNDYQPASGTLSFPPKSTDPQTVTVLVNGDNTQESNEIFTVDLSNPVNAGIGDGSGAGTIGNDDGTPTVDIELVALTLEGNAGTTPVVLNVTLSHPTDQPVTVTYQTADGTATLANNDYVAASGTLTIPPKAPGGQITVFVNGDLVQESNEVFTLTIANPTNASLGNGTAAITIQNDDNLPTLSITDVSLPEGNAGTTAFTFSVSMSNPSDQTVSVAFQTADGTATLANNDYQANAGLLVFPPKSTAPQTITVLVNGDLLNEPDETFFVNLLNPTNATLADGQGQGTILNDDGLPAISITDESVLEGNAGTSTMTFTISLSKVSGQTVTVEYQTADGTATVANNDYDRPPGTTATIPAGSLSTTLDVTIHGDTKDESDETFFVNLSNPTNATIADGQGVGTIRNDDGTPSVSIQPTGSTLEGNAGTVTVTLAVTLSNTTDQQVTVNYTTQDGTAKTSNNDYVAKSGTLTIPPKIAGGTITVTINGDVTQELDETFTVVLSAPTNATLGSATSTVTIQNDDGTPALSINDVSLQEGNTGGATSYVFTVSLNHPTDQAVTVQYTTNDGTAKATNFDYVPTSGTLTIPPKASSATIDVEVIGDLTRESNETFFVDLSSPVNATLADAQGQGTIQNDDLFPTLSISDVTKAEGNFGLTDFNFTVTLFNPSDTPITVHYQTADGTATVANNDYQAASGNLTIPPKTISGTITIKVVGDTNFEPDETFTVTLSSPSGATIADGSGRGTITDDEATATLLSTFEAETVNEGVSLSWQFSEATDLVSAWVERADVASGPWSRVVGEAQQRGGVSTVIDRSALSGHAYLYRIAAELSGGRRVAFEPIEGRAGAAVTEFALTRIAPNPTQGSTGIDYAVAREAKIRLRIIDLQGRVVATLVDGMRQPGRYQAQWNGRGPRGLAPVGVYFVHYEAGGKSAFRRLLMAR